MRESNDLGEPALDLRLERAPLPARTGPRVAATPTADLRRWARGGACLVCGGGCDRFYPIDAAAYLKSAPEDAQHLRFWLARCSACSHLQIDPMPTPALLDAVYQDYLRDGRDGFCAQHWMDDPTESPALRRLVPRLAEMRRLLPQGARVCEVGCATGSFLLLARQAGFDCVGVELSRGAAEFARTRRGLDVRAGTLEGANLPAASVDAVVMWDVIEHVPNPASLLRAARQVLRPGGLLVLETPDASSLLHQLARAAFAAGGARGMAGIYNIHHCHYFTPHSLGKMLSKQGFRLREASQDRTLLDAYAKWEGRSLRGRALVLAVRSLFLLARILRRENKIVAFANRGE